MKGTGVGPSTNEAPVLMCVPTLLVETLGNDLVWIGDSQNMVFVASGGDCADTIRAFAPPTCPEWPQRTGTAARASGGRVGSQRAPVRAAAVNGSSKTSIGRTGT